MRLGSLFLLLLILAGMSVAQDANQETNFFAGPQYLITSNSPMFLRSIATPTLSLSMPLPAPSFPVPEAVPEPPSPFAGPPPQPDLTRIFWGKPVTGAPETNENLGEIEISSATLSITLPPSLFETGAIGMTTAQSLRERGVGAPLGDTASFWKTHKTHAPRVYTNADLQRLHSS